MGRELEWKFSASAEQMRSVSDAYPTDFAPYQMRTTYYDTPDRDFSARKWTLRHRLENGVDVCTLKTPAENGARGEWEVTCADIRAAIPELQKCGAPAELTALAQKPLCEVCGARFLRRALTLDLPQCRVELALDSGFLLGGGQSAPLNEIEIEFKSGSEAAAHTFADDFAARFRLCVEPKSKYARALALAQGK